MRYLVLVALLGLTGCLNLAASDNRLIKTAAFDHDCPEDQIEIVSKDDGMGSGTYVLNVCGTEQRYKRAGTVYYDADNPPVQGG